MELRVPDLLGIMVLDRSWFGTVFTRSVGIAILDRSLSGIVSSRFVGLMISVF
jgi:hypothetical protein